MSNKLKVGDHIYLPSSLFSETGKIRVIKATISKITSAYGSTFVEVIELPDHSFNLDLLLPRQKELEGKCTPCKSEIKQILKGKIQAALVALEDVRSYVPSLFSDLDERELKQSKATLQRMRKKLK